MKIANLLYYLPCLSSGLVQFTGAIKPSCPQISPSKSQKGSSCRGPHLSLSLDKPTANLPRGFSTAISTLEVLAIGDRPLSHSLLCSVKIRSPPSVTLQPLRGSQRR
jgi:hypothetical protein